MGHTEPAKFLYEFKTRPRPTVLSLTRCLLSDYSKCLEALRLQPLVFPTEAKGERPNGKVLQKPTQSTESPRSRQGIEKMSVGQLRELVGQLQVRRSELELQIETLQGQADRLVRFRQLYQQAPIGTLYLSRQGIILDANSAAAELLGTDLEELPGSQFSSWVAESSQEDFANHARQVFADRDRHTCEIQLQRPDGSLREVHLECRTVDGPRGRGAQCQAAMIDITERKLAQETIEREPSRTEAIYLDVAEVIILVIGKDERILRINRKGCRILGYRKSELLGQNWFDLALPEDSREEVRQAFHRIVEGPLDGKLAYREDYVVTKSGEKRLIGWNNTVLTDESGAVTASLSSGEDITEKRQAEEALARSQRLNQAILDTCIEGIITIDQIGHIESFNPAAERIFGYKSKEVLGKKVGILMTDDERHKHDDYIRHYLDSGSPRIIGQGREVKGRRKDGTEFPMHLGVGEAFFEQNPVFVGTVRELTDVKKMQNELEQSRVFAALGEMSASIAHEIKNPLAAVSGVVQVLQDSIDKSDPRWEILVELAGRIEQMDNTVKRLLQFARPWRLNRQVFNLQEIVEEVIQSALKMGRFDKIRFVTGKAREVRVSVDLVLFQDVLWNLLYNAEEAMPGGGRVDVAIKSKSGIATLNIRDSGPGIDTDLLQKVFRPLFTTKSRGTGLGLAHCKKIMEAHGGTIQIANRPGGGTQVTLQMPRSASVED